jgi:hypothetical protein
MREYWVEYSEEESRSMMRAEKCREGKKGKRKIW